MLVELRRGRAGRTGVRASCVGPISEASRRQRHLLVVEPEAERLLGELLAGEVVVLLQDPRQEVGRDLDRRLADLPVERLGLLDDEDAEIRLAAAKEDRRRGAGDGAADDDDVVVSGLARCCSSLNGDLFRPDHGRMIVKCPRATRNR